MKNPNLSILMLAGAKDPVIQTEEKFNQLKTFLTERGYKNISTKLYEDKQHDYESVFLCAAIGFAQIDLFNRSHRFKFEVSALFFA